MVESLLAGSTNKDASFLAGFDGVDGIAVCTKAQGLAVENVVVEILLKITLGIIFQHEPHIAHGNDGHFGMAQERIRDAEHQRNFATFVFDRFGNRLEVIADDFWSVCLIDCGSIEQDVLQYLQGFAFALKMDCFGGALTEVNRNHAASLTRTKERGEGPGMVCGNSAQSTRFLFRGANKLE